MSKRASPAKISRPRLFDVVPRERLFELLDGNRGRPLIWIASPPGSGKTALVASYLEARGIPTIWYQVDASDADPAMLFHYLSQAAGALRQGEDPPLPRFVAEHLADLQAFASLFFRAFFARLPQGVVLVLDNYQEVAQDAPLHEIVEQCVAETPPEHSVVCISRQEAPGPFVRFAASGAMVFIGWDHLRLTLDEVKEVSARRGVTDGWLTQALHEQSQGWAAGVTLMLERLGHLDGPPGELPSDSRESVFNYFASLVFDRAPESTRHVLLSVAFLPQVTPALARELSGRPDAALVLEDLYRRRMFTDRRSGPEPVYQFHALFQAFLRAKAERGLSEDKRIGLLSRSAAALEFAADPDAALDLWIVAKNWEKATALIIEESRRLLNSGRRQSLQTWIRGLPPSVLERDARILYWLGLAQVQTTPAEGIQTLQKSLTRFEELSDMQGQVLCLAALLNAAFLGFLNLERMHRWLDELLDKMKSAQALLSPDVELRVWGVLCAALFWIRPWHPWAEHASDRVEQLLKSSGDANAALAAAAGALATASMSGRFECGDRIALATEHLVESPAASPTEAVWWLVHAGFMRFFETRYDESLRYLHRAGDIADRNGMRKTFVMATFHRCAVEFRVLGWGVAGATLAEMESAPVAYPMAEAMLRLLQARRAHYRGQRYEAANLAELADVAALRTGSRYQEMLFGLIEAELVADAGRIDKARTLVARSRATVEQAPVFDCWRAALEFVEAWLALREGDRSLALKRLGAALVLAREAKRKYYLRHFECAMPPLFKLALEEGIEVDLVRDVIRMFRLKPPQDAPESWPWPVRIVTLGRFEVQVDGQPVEFSRKLPRKTLLLLKSIVAHGGRNVPEQTLCDTLWGDEDGDAAANALAITVVRLRRLLGTNEAIIQQGGRISLNPELCWVDVWHFERLVTGNAPLGALLSVYGGAFLPEEEGEPWSVAARERLRGRFIDALSRHGATLEQQGDMQGAVQCYLRGIDADPIVETFHQGLMRCYERMGRRTEALSAYRRLKHTLSVVLGVPPSESTQQLFQAMLQRQSAEGSGAGDGSLRLDAEGALASRSDETGNVVRKLRPQRRQVR